MDQFHCYISVLINVYQQLYQHYQICAFFLGVDSTFSKNKNMYELNGLKLKKSEYERDQGVNLTTNLKLK